MEQFNEFVVNHWFLSGLFVGLVVAFIVNEIKHAGHGGISRLTAQDVVQLLNHGDGRVVDIRPQEAYSEGHIVSAVNIPKTSFETKLNSLQKYRNKPIIVVCAQGNESGKCAATLKSRGFEKIVQLAGGMRAWQEAGMPLTKK